MHHIYYLTQFAAPHKGMDVGEPHYLTIHVEYWPHHLTQFAAPQLENSNLHSHIYGESLHPLLKNLSLYFISFVSSKWIVINHQKGKIVSAIKL